MLLSLLWYYTLNLTKYCTRFNEIINNNNSETLCAYRVVNNDIYFIFVLHSNLLLHYVVYAL